MAISGALEMSSDASCLFGGVSTQSQLLVIRPGLSTHPFEAAAFYPSLASCSTLKAKKKSNALRASR
jgi:hypothetical protein